MAGPPTNIEPAALWVALQSMPRPQRVVDYPRIDPVTGASIGQITIRVLTQAEQMAAAAEADRFTNDLLKRKTERSERSDGYDTVYNNECSVQLLFRAVCRVDMDGVSLFPSPAHIREKVTQDEIGTLIREYLIVQRELGPIVGKMSLEEMDAWLEVLAQGGSAFPLARLDLEAVQDLVMHSARRLYPSPTVTSSSGSQPESSTPT